MTWCTSATHTFEWNTWCWGTDRHHSEEKRNEKNRRKACPFQPHILYTHHWIALVKTHSNKNTGVLRPPPPFLTDPNHRTYQTSSLQLRTRHMHSLSSIDSSSVTSYFNPNISTTTRFFSSDMYDVQGGKERAAWLHLEPPGQVGSQDRTAKVQKLSVHLYMLELNQLCGTEALCCHALLILSLQYEGHNQLVCPSSLYTYHIERDVSISARWTGPRGLNGGGACTTRLEHPGRHFEKAHRSFFFLFFWKTNTGNTAGP